jgi:hypothetical protein
VRDDDASENFRSPWRLAVPAVIVVSGWPLIVLAGKWFHASINADDFESWKPYLSLGLVCGTVYGQVALVAAWAAFGPAPWFIRLPLVALWLAILALVDNPLAIVDNPREFQTTLTAMGCQWLLLLLPLTAMSLFLGLKLMPQRDSASVARAQFGIREVLVYVAILGAALAVCNKVFNELPGLNLFLLAAAVVVTLPMLLASMSTRYVLLKTLAATIFVAVVTILEAWLLRQGFQRGWLLPLDVWHLTSINAVTYISILLIAGLMRWAGYRLAKGAR